MRRGGNTTSSSVIYYINWVLFWGEILVDVDESSPLSLHQFHLNHRWEWLECEWIKGVKLKQWLLEVWKFASWYERRCCFVLSSGWSLISATIDSQIIKWNNLPTLGFCNSESYFMFTSYMVSAVLFQTAEADVDVLTVGLLQSLANV